MTDIYTLLRDNIRSLIPYSTARNEFNSEASICLDANENNYPFAYNRYPDPYQKKLKKVIAEWKNVQEREIFIGNGSDEIIDLVIRAFCKPGLDAIVALEPTYGMYAVSAAINDVAYRKFLLDRNFEFDTDGLIDFFKPTDKILFICSPNNPTGNAFSVEKMHKLIGAFPGIVLVDEAYIDFSSTPSMLGYINRYPNLIVMQTLSKSMAAAGLRVGMAFMNTALIDIFNRIKPPYNISEIVINAAVERLSEMDDLQVSIHEITAQRAEFNQCLSQLKYVKKVFPSEANFVLVQVNQPLDLYQYLIGKGIVVRDRSKQYNCEDCLRISIGTPVEMQVLREALESFSNL
jgi:histidinol-phosphate aminotransferase